MSIAYAVNFDTHEVRAYSSTNLANATLITADGEPDMAWGVYVTPEHVFTDKGAKLDALVALYNSIVAKLPEGKPRTKFTDRREASDKLLAVFDAARKAGIVQFIDGRRVPPPKDATAEVGSTAPKGKGKATSKAAKADGKGKADGKPTAKADGNGKAPRASTKGQPRGGFAGCTIVVRKPYMAENPRREGTAGNLAFELLRKAGGRMGYEQYLKAGGAGNHALWDWLHGFTEIEQPDGTLRSRPANPTMHGKPVKYTAVLHAR